MVVTGPEVMVYHQLQVLGDEDEVHAAEAELRQAQEDGDQDSANFKSFQCDFQCKRHLK